MEVTPELGRQLRFHIHKQQDILLFLNIHTVQEQKTHPSNYMSYVTICPGTRSRFETLLTAQQGSSVAQDTIYRVQACFDAIMVWTIYTWHALGSLIHKNLQSVAYISPYHDRCPLINSNIYGNGNLLLQREK